MIVPVSLVAEIRSTKNALSPSTLSLSSSVSETSAVVWPSEKPTNGTDEREGEVAPAVRKATAAEAG